MKTHLCRIACRSSSVDISDVGQPVLDERQGKQGGVALIHVIACDMAVPQLGKDRHASHAEHHFLAETIVRITAVQIVCQCLIKRAVLWKSCVEQVDRNHMTFNSLNHEPPGSYFHLASLYGNRNLRFHRLQHSLGVPGGRLFCLIPLRVESLW